MKSPRCRTKPSCSAAGALVLEDHPAIGVELAFVDVLAADEGEIDRPRIVGRGRGDRPADAAAVPFRVGEAIPIGAGRLEPARRAPGRSSRRPRRPAPGAARRRAGTPRPRPPRRSAAGGRRSSNGRRVHRITLSGVRVARSDAFGIEVAPLAPIGLRSGGRRRPRRATRPSPRQSGRIRGG